MEGVIIFILLAAVIALLAGDRAPSAVAPPVVILQSSPAPREAGCLLPVLIALIGAIVWALLANS